MAAQAVFGETARNYSSEAERHRMRRVLQMAVVLPRLHRSEPSPRARECARACTPHSEIRSERRCAWPRGANSSCIEEEARPQARLVSSHRHHACWARSRLDTGEQLCVRLFCLSERFSVEQTCGPMIARELKIALHALTRCSACID